jgi:prepilin-type N-terminal cleavage/methylation domain-containing protein
MSAINKKSGFTIVELLIVVVVIAILAAITTVSFSGITDRAKAASQVSAVIGYAKIINAYAATNGAYPVPTAIYACLGNPSGQNSCGSTTGGQNACGYGGVTVDALLNTKLATVATLPVVPWNTYQCAAAAGRGIIYAYYSATSVMIYFWVNGSTCPTISGTNLVSTITENTNSSCAISFS